jgi:FixJ family two-component response regulator
VRESLLRELSDLGHACAAFGAPASLLDAGPEDFDAFILDMSMGADLDGLGLAAEIGRRRAAAPCVIVTGGSTPEALARLKAGGVPFLVKPVATARILGTLFPAG